METKECIKIMQAHLKGKKIQICNRDGIWERIDNPKWNFAQRAYRLEMREYTFEELKELVGKTILYYNKYPIKIIGCGEGDQYQNGYLIGEGEKKYGSNWLYSDFYYKGKLIAKRLEP